MNIKPTTGKYSIKPYQCDICGHEEEHGTNHWGQIYNIKCKGCGYKPPFFSSFTCLEQCPNTHDIPEPWTSVTLVTNPDIPDNP